MPPWSWPDFRLHKSIRRQLVYAFVARNIFVNGQSPNRSPTHLYNASISSSVAYRTGSLSVFGGATSCQGLPWRSFKSSTSHFCQRAERPQMRLAM